MTKKLLALLCALAMILSMGTAAMAEGKTPGVIEGKSYISDKLHGGAGL